MKKEMVLHIPMSQYAHGIAEDKIVIRLRTAKDDLQKVTLFYGDTACRQNPIIFYPEKMNKVAGDLYFDYYEAEFVSKFHRIYYYFLLEDGTESSYYYSDFFRSILADDRSEYYKIPFNHREDIADVPEWVKDAVVYNIFPDSFASAAGKISGACNKKLFQNEYMTEPVCTSSNLGGTIKGIGENAEYLKELGINCIYINPIFAAGEYHKYDTLDYFHIDPCFGTNEDFKEMVKIMHQNGIRVIIDGVFNHCGWKFFAFEDVVKNGEKSKYVDWFYKLTYPVIRPETPDEIPDYECFAYERLMPKLNTANKEVQEYLLKVGRYWVEEFDIDGWRLDVASEVNDDFWREFRKAVRSVKKDCFIIGEVWENGAHWMQGDMFDSTMNYDVRKSCSYFFAKGEIDSAIFDAAVTNMRLRYRKNLQYGQLNLLDSHDVSRFLSVCGENVDKWKLAVVFQMMFLGVPSVFYGDEQGFVGNLEVDYRRKMEFDTKGELFSFYKELIGVRKREAAIRRGDYKTLFAKERSFLYAFSRSTENENVIVILNAADNKEDLDVVWENIPEIGSGNYLKDKVLLQHNFDANKLGNYGYLVLKV